jgi:transcriptional regulator
MARETITIDAVIRMKENGMKHADIARYFGCSSSNIAHHLKKRAIPRISVSDHVITTMNEAAKARGITLADLVSRLVEVAACGGPGGSPMIDAILDDEAE